MAFLCIAFMGKKLKWRHVHSTSFQASLHIPFPPGKLWSEASPNFPHQNKGFINYVFCRNRAVRNPAGTRLESSLVTKQVGEHRKHQPGSAKNTGQGRLAGEDWRGNTVRGRLAGEDWLGKTVRGTLVKGTMAGEHCTMQ